MARAIVYIDGQNFHYGLKRVIPRADSYNFNFRKLAEFLAKGKDLVAIKYYCAKYPAALDITKHNRDDAFVKHLVRTQQVTVIEGAFKINEFKERGRKVRVPVEKGVDVRLATDLIIDGIYNSYDQAYVISDDTDLVPAITQLKHHRQNLKVFNFAFRKLNEFGACCDHSGMLFPDKLKKWIEPENFPATHVTAAALATKFRVSKGS